MNRNRGLHECRGQWSCVIRNLTPKMKDEREYFCEYREIHRDSEMKSAVWYAMSGSALIDERLTVYGRYTSPEPRMRM